ncbi:DegT/DnrJ/EryC1/StrS family aminotransferase [Myroides marinus]|uniref:DegT/DnrJ/EryC1/StrS family aminotransferase n=1 Tax=Myroides marinus TaxID=703342 RepID=UPI0025767E64|nr:DegT/DnrJ/EryC1/StrS family aminotransferase [Myroides marinus]MDM1380259.1 DegT/DnrJ/EryC1/StrS family aminotransferase [Myroides marinus]MDM1387526.1 DegT/DnrJ/EryC1/StrS family aminotransferase [Myroides marinus]MDM1394738.1 DegT/DnrJ/EryC1/StrS family aminotransferase [Myroides marinus]MDM1501055.1 DegT/DnrJ/EryC1/StrS family aminotransferase [Myroides marinus]
MIPVVKPFLPPFEEYKLLLEGIWERCWLTNMGPLATELEIKLQKLLNVSNLLFVTNGTVALQMAIKALDLKGEIITTPFSFVATTSTIVWEGCTPVFVDIDRDSLTIDVEKIEAAITSNTVAILATHVYGNPCDVEVIDIIAKKHNLKVIYDGAHAFGVEYKGKSIFEYGDISTCSLHATKLYHSTEGGFIVTKNKDLNIKLQRIRNFGISGFDTFSDLGLNGKNSEMHAAMGIANLKYIDHIHAKRKTLYETYTEELKDFNAVQPVWREEATMNYPYFPLVLESEELLLKVREALLREDIHLRRYFYPSLASSLPYLPEQLLEVTEDVAKRAICLPFYYDLEIEDVKRICEILKST